MYETNKDRSIQRDIMRLIENTLLATAFVGHHFKCVEMPSTGKQDHDVNVLYKNDRVGIIEIKNRSRDSKYLERNGYLILRQKLAYLWRMDKKGIPAMLAVHTKDKCIYVSMIEHLVENKSLWSVAPPEKHAENRSWQTHASL